MPGESLQLLLLQDLRTTAAALSPDLGSALRAWLQGHRSTNGYKVERGILLYKCENGTSCFPHLCSALAFSTEASLRASPQPPGKHPGTSTSNSSAELQVTSTTTSFARKSSAPCQPARGEDSYTEAVGKVCPCHWSAQRARGLVACPCSSTRASHRPTWSVHVPHCSIKQLQIPDSNRTKHVFTPETDNEVTQNNIQRKKNPMKWFGEDSI